MKDLRGPKAPYALQGGQAKPSVLTLFCTEVLTICIIWRVKMGIWLCLRRERHPCAPESSHRVYQLNGFRKANPPQNRQLVVYYYESKRYVDDFVGELTL